MDRAGLTERARVALPQAPAPSVTRTPSEKVPAAEGVPLKAPPEEILSQDGQLGHVQL
jgi:hypothetical protein